jgi:hypothetical protein
MLTWNESRACGSPNLLFVCFYIQFEWPEGSRSPWETKLQDPEDATIRNGLQKGVAEP